MLSDASNINIFSGKKNAITCNNFETASSKHDITYDGDEEENSATMIATLRKCLKNEFKLTAS